MRARLQRATRLFRSLVIRRHKVIPDVVFEVIAAVGDKRREAITTGRCLSQDNFLAFFLSSSFLYVKGGGIRIQVVGHIRGNSTFVRGIGLSVEVRRAYVFQEGSLHLIGSRGLARKLRGHFIQHGRRDVITGALVFQVFFYRRGLVRSANTRRSNFARARNRDVSVIQMAFPMLFRLLGRSVNLLFYRYVTGAGLAIKVVKHF